MSHLPTIDRKVNIFSTPLTNSITERKARTLKSDIRRGPLALKLHTLLKEGI